MRCGPHVMLALDRGTQARRLYELWITAARPPLVKFCRQGFDPDLMDWTRAQGTKIVGRWVEGDISDGGRTLAELLPFAGHLDYIEFANEESQGKDDPNEWDRLMGKALDFLRDLDEANRRAGRQGPRGCVVNASVGCPELERWTRPSTLEVARYVASNGHRWGLHEYYKPRPWSLVIGDRAAWDGTAPARGWLMLRCEQVVSIFRDLGIDFRFLVTESGRDNVPGQPGDGGGWRDEPTTPDGNYAEFMRQYGRHLSALPCDGWVDYGYNAWKGWKQFDLSEDIAMCERFIALQMTLPRGGETTNGGTMNETTAAAIRAAGDATQVLRLNRGAAIQKRATADGFTLVGNETAVDVAGHRYTVQKAEHATSGEARYYYATDGDWSRIYSLGKS